jgi:hypothetical protein
MRMRTASFLGSLFAVALRHAWGAGIAHGDGKLYVGSHTERKLGGWICRIDP